ncbi:hypothetical protein ES703_09178 [subsurface metagenome]
MKLVSRADVLKLLVLGAVLSPAHTPRGLPPNLMAERGDSLPPWFRLAWPPERSSMVLKLNKSRADRRRHAQEFIRRNRDAVLRTYIETEGDWEAKHEAGMEHMRRIFRGLEPNQRHMARRIEFAVVKVLKEAKEKAERSK